MKFMDNKTELEKIKVEIESKEEEKKATFQEYESKKIFKESFCKNNQK